MLDVGLKVRMWTTLGSTGAVYNPVQALCDLRVFHDDDNRVTVDGFTKRYGYRRLGTGRARKLEADEKAYKESLESIPCIH